MRCEQTRPGSRFTAMWRKKRTSIAYASRFLIELESKYSIIELELLAVVWSIEHFKNYVYGVAFGIVSDHKALQSVIKSNKSNKTFSSGLTRWTDFCLVTFRLNIPGRTLGMADYLSRHPSEYESSVAKAEKLFNDWFTVNVVKEITPEMKRLARVGVNQSNRRKVTKFSLREQAKFCQSTRLCKQTANLRKLI